MSNYKLHEKAQELADTRTDYELAKELLQARQTIRDLQEEIITLHKRESFEF